MAVNYGVDKVRFPSPVKVGTRVRAGAELIEVTDVAGTASRPRRSSPSRSRAGEALLRDRVARALVPLMAATEAPAGAAIRRRRQAAPDQVSDAEIDAFVAEKHTLSIATVNRDGSIHMVAMWYGFLEGEIAFTSKAKAQKVVNLRRNPNITVMVEEGEAYNELVGVQIRGRRRGRRRSRADVREGKSVFERHTGPYTREAPQGRVTPLQARRHQGESRPYRLVGPPQALTPPPSRTSRS